MRYLAKVIKAAFATLKLWWRSRFVRWEVVIDYRKSSSLRRLLLRNLYAEGGINDGEYKLALRLIDTVPESDEVCDVCNSGRLAIVDTRHCRQCNRMLLEKHPMIGRGKSSVVV